MSVDVERIATIVEWAHQERPLVLAPNQQMGKVWLSELDPLLTKALKRRPDVLSAKTADRSLRGRHGGILIVVKAGYRQGEPYHGLNDDVNQVVEEVVPYTRMTVWTEWLP